MQKFRFWFLTAMAIVAFGVALRAEESQTNTVPLEDAVEDSPASAATAAAEANDDAPTAAPAAEDSKNESAAPAVEAPATATNSVLAEASGAGQVVRVKVIPIRDVIDKPILFLLRRGLKEAQAEGMQAVVIDMNTPGGRVDVTLDIIDALDKFDGKTLVYITQDAISAGALISAVADEIHFAPRGVIGAAAVVSGGGQDVAETMTLKVNSVMNAKIRAYNEAGATFRAEVIKAMMDSEYEFKIGDIVIKPKGELLSLTAYEAIKTYGDPAQPLLSAGTHESIEALLNAKYGENGYTVTRLEMRWSEELASWIASIAPVLMGLGLLGIFVEFKTPGFGVFGVLGGLMLALVFFGHYTAGLSGHEAALVFALGLVLVALEIFLFPGTLVAGLTGAALMFGALVWSMIDVWPGEMPSFDGETLFTPMLNVAIAFGVAVIGALALGRSLPRGLFWDRMILSAAVSGDAGAPAFGMSLDGTHESAAPEGGDGLLGARGLAVSMMRPMGEVEIAGRRHEARAALGSLERGEAVRVVGRSGRMLIVEADVA